MIIDNRQAEVNRQGKGESGAKILKPSKFKVANPSNPSSFKPQFDILYAVDKDREKYIGGDKSLSISGLPDACRTNICRLKAKSNKGSISSVLTASIYYGVSQIAARPEIKPLFTLRYRYDSAPDDLPGVISATIFSFLDKFPITVPTGSRTNIRLSEGQYGALTRVAGELGISITPLTILSIYYTLVEQDYINTDDKQEMREALEKFYSMAEVRGRAAKCLMDEFKVPQVDLPPIWDEEEFYV